MVQDMCLIVRLALDNVVSLLAPPRPLRGNLGRCLPPDPRHTLIAGVIAFGYGKLLAAPAALCAASGCHAGGIQ